MVTEISIAFVCLLGSFATFFSGFGLGTILLPVFSLYFSVELAILATAIVHFANNLFKLSIMSRHIDIRLFKQFGMTALIGALLGANLLTFIGKEGTLYASPFFEGKDVSAISFLIGVLMVVFVIFEWKKIKFPGSNSPVFLPMGGFISGFFGGLSGHQGALRSAFLSKIELDKHLFVATSALISTLIDFSRISVYAGQTKWGELQWRYLMIGATAAFLGSILGKKYLQKVSYNFIRYMVAFFLLLMAGLLLSGLI